MTAPQRIDELLRSRGWTGAFDALPGVTIEGFGEVALQYQHDPQALLRLEVHAVDAELEIHLHVTDANDIGFDFAFRPHERVFELVDAIIAIQHELTTANVEQMLPRLLAVSPEVAEVEPTWLEPGDEVIECKTLEEAFEDFVRKLPYQPLTEDDEAATCAAAAAARARILAAIEQLPDALRPAAVP